MRVDNSKAAKAPANGTAPVAECPAAAAGKRRKIDALLSLRCPVTGLGHQTIDDVKGCIAEAERDYHAYYDFVAIEFDIRHCCSSPAARSAEGTAHHRDGSCQVEDRREQSKIFAAYMPMKPAPYLSEKRAAVAISINTAVFTLGAIIFGH
jgi:hypothetical protein